MLAVELAAARRRALAAQDGEAAVTGVTHSSSAVRAGDLYAALPGGAGPRRASSPRRPPRPARSRC